MTPPRSLGRLVLAGTALLAVQFRCASIVPSAEALLPTNTLAYVTVPDLSRARVAWRQQALGRLWADPVMGQFRSRFEERLRAELVHPLSQALGLDLARLAKLAEGQVTLALVQNTADGTHATVGQLLMIDTGSRREELVVAIQSTRQEWTAGGRPLTTNAIRDAEFLTLTVPRAAIARVIQAAFPTDEPPGEPDLGAADPPLTLHIGQKESLFLAGTDTNTLDAVLARLADKGEALKANPILARDAARMFKDTTGHAWVNAEPVVAMLEREAGRRPTPAGRLASRAVHALGLRPLGSLAFSAEASAKGLLLQLVLGIPKSEHRGLFKILELKPADSAPPAFVPRQVDDFLRLRVDGSAAWHQFEETLLDLDPKVVGLIQLFLGLVGKIDDETFDFRESFFANLGDDFLFWRARPAADSAAASPAAGLLLIASPKPSELMRALALAASPKYLNALLPPDANGPQVRRAEVDGRPMVSVTLPPAPWLGGATNGLHFATREGYLGLSFSAPVLEAWLRATNAAAPLASRPSLARALEQVGGAGGGYFAYTDRQQRMRRRWDTLARRPEAFLEDAGWLGMAKPTARLAAGVMKWFDFARLPPFDQVAVYFDFQVDAGQVTADGLQLRSFEPRPTGLVK